LFWLKIADGIVFCPNHDLFDNSLTPIKKNSVSLHFREMKVAFFAMFLLLVT